MKIATMVRGIFPALKDGGMIYSPLQVAITVAEGLHKRGHPVTYFGPTGTSIKAKTETYGIKPLVETTTELQRLVETKDLFTAYVPGLWGSYFVKQMFEKAARGEFDLLHFHHPEVALPFVSMFPNVPVVYTLHDYVDERRRQATKLHDSKNQFYVSISDHQRTFAPDFNYAGTVYNGIDTSLFKPDGDKRDYLLFAGRIIKEKGAKEAVQVALKTNSKLLIAGPLLEKDQGYFDKYIKPYLNRKIRYLGYVKHEKMVGLYQNAKALLMPVQWEEPFGLTMIEAMSCGTPVIALSRGSIPEVVVDGKTGFITNSLSGMAKAVGKLGSIKSADCRRHVEKNFSNEKMINNYELTFKEIIKKHKESG